MFGYVRPPINSMSAEDNERFRHMYCGLCHTLRHRHGFAARFILNYDFTFLAILLSDGEEPVCQGARCVASPLKRRTYCTETDALALAADESVILAYWQLRDGVADHGFWGGLRYRFLSGLLRRSYRRAAALRPDFDASTRRQLNRLAQLEAGQCASIDQPADAFAQLLAEAASATNNPIKRRILHQMLYHIGRWIYLMDAADDLKQDRQSGSYNPLILRYKLSEDALDEASRSEFTETVDHSIHQIATAYELWDFGCWNNFLETIVYSGLFQVGKAVLDGTFQSSVRQIKNQKNDEENT